MARTLRRHCARMLSTKACMLPLEARMLSAPLLVTSRPAAALGHAHTNRDWPGAARPRTSVSQANTLSRRRRPVSSAATRRASSGVSTTHTSGGGSQPGARGACATAAAASAGPAVRPRTARCEAGAAPFALAAPLLCAPAGARPSAACRCARHNTMSAALTGAHTVDEL
jgi:hypothetical protein